MSPSRCVVILGPVEVQTPPCPDTSTKMSLCSGREQGMSITNPKSGFVSHADIVPDSRPADMSGPAGLVASGQTDLLAKGLKESLGRVATLAVISLRAARASVMVAGKRSLPTMSCPSGFGGQPSMFEQLMCADVTGSGHKLIFDNTRVDGRASISDPPGPASTMAWAGIPVHDQDGHVLGVLWAADPEPR